MTHADHHARVALAEIIIKIRPAWPHWLICSVLQAHAHNVTLEDLTIAAVRVAMDKTIDTPKAIGWKSRHYRDLDTAPMIVSKQRERCDICGKTEERCVTDRPGPDDHVYTPHTPEPRRRSA